MKDFSGKIAVVTGGGTGMGRELARQLVAEGCHVATCDIIEENLAETLGLCKAEAAQGVVVTGHPCDVADEKQVQAFRDKVQDQHETSHINLLFNNAGIGGGGSFVESSREEWERTFNICWNGVYYFTRAFMPMLMKSTEGHIINTSSVNGFRASLGGNIPHTVYSAAKFAVKGFSEGFDSIEDLALLKSDYFLFLQQGSTVKGRLFRIHGVSDNKEQREFLEIGAEEIEERGTGWPI